MEKITSNGAFWLHADMPSIFKTPGGCSGIQRSLKPW